MRHPATIIVFALVYGLLTYFVQGYVIRGPRADIPLLLAFIGGLGYLVGAVNHRDRG